MMRESSLEKPVNICTQLQAAMLANKQSRSIIATQSGTTTHMIDLFMNGDHDISLSLAAKIATALGLELSPIQHTTLPLVSLPLNPASKPLLRVEIEWNDGTDRYTLRRHIDQPLVMPIVGDEFVPADRGPVLKITRRRFLADGSVFACCTLSRQTSEQTAELLKMPGWKRIHGAIR
jgi:hypothetical protein